MEQKFLWTNSLDALFNNFKEETSNKVHVEWRLKDTSLTPKEDGLDLRRNFLQNHPFVGDVRGGKGLLIGIELVADKETEVPIDVSIVNQVIASCKQKGVIIGKNGATVAGYNNVLTLAPPLTIEEEDLTFLIQTLKDALYEVNND